MIDLYINIFFLFIWINLIMYLLNKNNYYQLKILKKKWIKKNNKKTKKLIWFQEF